MEFLRRLHPGRGQEVGAARLDVAPRWRARPEEAPGDAPGLAKAPPRGVDAPAARGGRSTAALLSADADADAPAMPATAAVPSQAAPARRPRGAPAAEVTALPREAAAAPRPAATPPAAAALPPATGGRPAEAAARSPVATDRQAAAPRRSASAAPATPQAPLRIEALPSERAAPPAPPSVVHVTIDRIDVRLPTAAPAPAARERRPRPASTVTTLADYLRNGPRGGGKP